MALTKTRVLRGFTEIENLFHFIDGKGAFICGGWVRYMCSPRSNPTPGADVDVYCRNQDAFHNVARGLEKHLSHRHENRMALTFHTPDPNQDPHNPFFGCPPIQLIKPVNEGRVVSFGSMEEILHNFDFTIIRGALLNKRWALVDEDFFRDESNGVLRLRNIHCPVSSTLRCMKYAAKGYWLPPMQALKLFQDWDGRTQEYKDQLIHYLERTEEGRGLTQQQIDELEEMMRID